MSGKEIFDTIVGLSTIGAFITALLAFIKITEIKNIIYKSNNVKQSMDKTKVSGKSKVTQVGRDYTKGE